MRKIIFLIFFLLLLWISNSSSAWYWKHSVSKTHWDWTTWCDSDWDTTWWSPNFSKSPLSWSYNYDSRVNWSVNSDYMWCEYWDWSNPQDLSVWYTDWWTNSAKTITVKAKDRWGSKLKKIILQQSQNWWSWSTVRTWDNLTYNNNTLVTKTWTRNPVDNSEFKYKIIAYDYAWNSSTVTNDNLIQFDTTPPSASEITSNLANLSYFIPKWNWYSKVIFNNMIFFLNKNST